METDYKEVVRVECSPKCKIYTSYFANIKNLEKDGIVPVAICAMVPSWFDGINIGSVAPSKDILFEHKKSAHSKEDDERYKQRYYNEILVAYRFHPEYIIDFIERVSDSAGGKDIALVCYEKPGDFCHRHLLAEWLKERTGIEIKEWGNYVPDIVNNVLF